MKQQLQAQSDLQVQSQQLTHYLNDWIVEDRRRGLAKIKSTLHITKKYNPEEKVLILKDKDKKQQKQRTEVCRIEFPILQERSKSSKDLVLPLIKPRSILYNQQRKTKLRLGRSQQKLSHTPSTLIFKSALSSSATAQAYHKQIQKKLARKRKRNQIIRNPQANSYKKVMQIDVSEIKAILMKQLKHSRRSALKDSPQKQNYKENHH